MLSAEDMFAIHNLYARYNLCSDAGDAEGYADCFTDDGVLETRPIGMRREGRADLLDHKRSDVANRKGRYRRHWNGSLHIEAIDERSARGRCYLTAYNGEPQQPPVIADCGVYEDLVVRGDDGAWRFRSRRLELDYTTWSLTPRKEGGG